MLVPEERRRLLAVARRSLVGHFSGKAAPRNEPVGPVSPHQGGAFVTLRSRDGTLRGCVGVLESADPLEDTVARMAVAAASDRRFDPLRQDELAEIVIEVSALGALRKVRPEEIEVGRDGLLVREGERRGVLLPQVASDHGWDRDTFLDKTCGKAGLPAKAWRGATAEIFAFTATVFGEDGSEE